MRIHRRLCRRVVIPVLASLSVATAPVLATATTPRLVQLSLEVSLGTPTDFDTPCSVTVVEDSDGVAVLDAGVAAGCIASYELLEFSFGDFVECIEPHEILEGSDREELCTVGEGPVLLAFWLMLENGKPACHGVRDFRARSGDVLEFSYSAGPVPVEFDC